VVPALALADVLVARGHRVAFCGTERGMEKDLVPKAGYPFSLVRVRGFQRKLGLSTVRTIGSIPLAAVDAWKILRADKPDCVVGVGAYASGPVVAEAAVRGIPSVVVEMDAHMGVTNRILSRLVDKVCLSFPRADLDPGKYVYTGRPLRPALLAATRQQGLERFKLDGSRRVLLVFGGSLGSRTLNVATTKAFASKETSFQVLHVTGQREYSAVADLLKQEGSNRDYQAFPFLDDFPFALAAADAVVARAGGSVAEILARGVPSLLVPYPLAAGDHQTINAKMVAGEGAAFYVPDAELDEHTLVEAVADLLDPETNQKMRAAALRLSRPDAAGQIADVVVASAAERAERDHG